jgi:hypothetical protein
MIHDDEICVSEKLSNYKTLRLESRLGFVFSAL